MWSKIGPKNFLDLEFTDFKLLFNVRNEQTNEKSYIGDALTRHSSMYIITRL